MTLVLPSIGEVGADYHGKFAALFDRVNAQSGAAMNGIAYVSKSTAASDDNDGFSWGTAKATIGAAVTALGEEGGTVNIGGGTYVITEPLPNTSNVRYCGASAPNGTLIRVDAGSLFSMASGNFYNLYLDNIAVTTYDGHIFNFTGSSAAIGWHLRNCEFISLVDSASILYFHSSGMYLACKIYDGSINREATSDVPLISIVSPSSGLNHNLFERIVVNSKECNSTPAILVECSHAGDGGSAVGNRFSDLVGEQNLGGFIHLYSAKGTLITECYDWDGGLYADHLFVVGKSSSNPTLSSDTTIINAGRRSGSLAADKYDYYGPEDVSQSAVLINVGGTAVDSPTIVGAMVQIGKFGIQQSVHPNIPFTGLLGYWEMNVAADAQSIPSIWPCLLGNTYPLQVGETAGVEASDPTRSPERHLEFVAGQYLLSASFNAEADLDGPWTVMLTVKCNGVTGGPLMVVGDVSYTEVAMLQAHAVGSVSAYVCSTAQGVADTVPSPLVVPTDAFIVLALTKAPTGVTTITRTDTGASASTVARTLAGDFILALGWEKNGGTIDAMIVLSASFHNVVLSAAEIRSMAAYHRLRGEFNGHAVL